MLLRTFFDAIELHRGDKFVSARFLRPFKVISTCPANGGLADHLDMVFNHQCCEPAGHQMAHLMAAHRRPLQYQDALLADHGLSGKAAGLGTAANMHNLCIAEENYRELAVVAVATGGVEGNAARAGDPASYHEYDGVFHRIGNIGPGQHGTINVMLAVNTPLTDGAMVRTVMTATEAKAAVLQELSIPSRQSPAIATGTGTDQIAVMAPAEGAAPLSSAGHHGKLGELIGRAVTRAIRDTLVWQNGLTPNRQCSCGLLLERFGAGVAALSERIAALLPTPELAELARANLHAVDRDPPSVAAAAALIHLHDQVGWGVIPPACWPEIAAQQAALLAAAASGCFDRLADYRGTLAVEAFSSEVLVTLVATALALGFADKWRGTAQRLHHVAHIEVH